MKKILLILLIVLLCASFADAYVYRTISKQPRIPRSPAGAMIASLSEVDGGLGSTSLTIHPYTIGNREATSVRPGIPLVAKLVLRKKTINAPITQDVSALLVVIGPSGIYELYGTSNIPGIMASNVLGYDPSPDVQAWTNDKLIAGADVNEQLRYVVFIQYGDEARYIGLNLNVR